MKVKRYKRKKKRKPFYKRKFFWFSILSVLSFFGLVYLFLFSPVFEIRQIKTQGCNFLDCSQLERGIERQSKFLFFKTDNIFLFNRKEAQKILLQSFLAIEKVTIKRKLPDKFLIEITERKPKAAFCFESGCFLVDKTGFAFRMSDDSLGLASICSGREAQLGKTLVSTPVLNVILEIEQELSNKTALKTKCYHILEDKIEVTLRDYNFSLYFSKDKDISLQIADLELLLEDQFSEEEFGNLEYIDLRFDKIFLK